MGGLGCTRQLRVIPGTRKLVLLAAEKVPKIKPSDPFLKKRPFGGQPSVAPTPVLLDRRLSPFRSRNVNS